MKKLLFVALLFPLTSFCQIDLNLTSANFRSGVDQYYVAGLEYYTVSETQLEPIYFSANFWNNSTFGANNVYLEVIIYEDGNVVDAIYSDSVSVCSYCNDSIFIIQPFTPGTGDIYDFVYTLYTDGSEVDPVNNSKTQTIHVDHNYLSAYRRDDSNYTGAISTWPGLSGAIAMGNIYEFFQDATVCGVSMYVSSELSNLGGFIYGMAVQIDTSNNWTWVDQTIDYEVQQSDLGSYVDLYFNHLDVHPGDYYVIMAGHYGDPLSVKFGQAQQVDLLTSFIMEDYYALWSMPNYKAMMVYPIMSSDQECGVGLDEQTNSPFKLLPVAPNPSKGIVEIKYNLSENGTVHYVIHDISGNIIASDELGDQKAGFHNVKRDFTMYESGVYFITLFAGTQQQTQKMIITE